MFKKVFGSGFLVRTAHVILTWVVTLILFLHDTELRKQEETGFILMTAIYSLPVHMHECFYYSCLSSKEYDFYSKQNHRWFVLYLAVGAAHWLLSCLPTWQLWLHSNGLLLAVAVLVAVLSLIVLLLLCSHLYLVSLNTTTWEFMSHHRISYLKHCGIDENTFDRGTFHNLWGFFCVWGTVVWEQVYFKKGSDQV
uniref:Uncharacterized protein n=1 Tax=Mola mola TaxID=94237 RepID=A0A3Q3VU49_MOLML